MNEALANASDAILDDIIFELEGLEPDVETVLRQKYSRIHMAIANAVARGATTRQILELLKFKGLDIHHAKLGKLYKAEIASRDERGERICCVTCGQPFKLKEKGVDESANGDANTAEEVV